MNQVSQEIVVDDQQVETHKPAPKKIQITVEELFSKDSVNPKAKKDLVTSPLPAISLNSGANIGGVEN
jgi:hypothetical protein